MGVRKKGGLIGGFDQLRAPDAPTISVSVGNAQVTVTFTDPSDTGGGDISSYTATAIASGVSTGATSSSSPVTITGLTNGTSYSVTGLANNAFGASPYSSATSSSPYLPDRGLLAGMSNSGWTYMNNIDYITISSAGNASDFGDMTAAKEANGSAASKTRALFAGGRAGSVLDTIDFVAISSTGNASDFGDLVGARYILRGLGSDTRAIIVGDNSNVIEYLTIASTGNGTDFGDRTNSAAYIGGASSTTRGVFGGGYASDGTYYVAIDYITIASTGNASDFGDLTGTSSNSGRAVAALSNNTRAVFGGGYFNGSVGNVMQYITIASAGNATDFGDLVANNQGQGGTSNATRGVFTGGGTDNVIEYITIGSTGNTTDFGDISQDLGYLMSATSSSHGGLS